MNDWRLTGQEEYLFNVELKKISQEEIKNKKDKTDKSILRNIQVNKRQYRMVGKFVNSKRYSKNEKNE